MLMIPLQSGSNGNCVYVESGDVGLLFDAGIAASVANARLAAYGRSLADVRALFISHEHADHVSCAGVLARAAGIPLYMTARTFAAARRRYRLEANLDIVHFRAGDTVKVGHVEVTTIPTPHDAVDGVVFLVSDPQNRLAICTDFGHVYDELRDIVGVASGLYMESNFDEERLHKGPYPAALKRRIAGGRGHISNAAAAELVATAASANLQWLCLAHLSAKNNTTALALAAHRQALGERLPIVVAQRHRVSAVLQLQADLFNPRPPAPPCLLPLLPVASPELASFWQLDAKDEQAALRRRVRQRRAAGGCDPSVDGGFSF